MTVVVPFEERFKERVSSLLQSISIRVGFSELETASTGAFAVAVATKVSLDVRFSREAAGVSFRTPFRYMPKTKRDQATARGRQYCSRGLFVIVAVRRAISSREGSLCQG